MTIRMTTQSDITIASPACGKETVAHSAHTRIDRAAVVSILLAAHATRHHSAGVAVADVFGPARGAEAVYVALTPESVSAPVPYSVAPSHLSLRQIMDAAFCGATSVDQVNSLIAHLSPYRAARALRALGYDPALPHLADWQRKMLVAA